MRKFLTLISVVAMLVAIGCSSQPGSNLSGSTNQISGIASVDSSLSADAAEWLAEDTEDFTAWQKVLVDPGEAGVDYDPEWVVVNYFRDASPSTSMTGTPATGLTASDGRNSILRVNPGFETITDAIAAKFGLEIGSQVYYGKLNYACFGVPEGIDGNSLITDIRTEFSSVAEYVTYDRIIEACYDPNDPYFVSSTATEGHQWPLKKCRFDEAWDLTRGEPSVRIAIVDTGCLITHEELVSQVLNPLIHFPGEQLDIANNDNTMEDNQGHGTFLCGLVGATGDNNRTLIGAAPNCEVIPVKMSEDGSANHGSFAEGCLLGFTLGAKAINLSWRSTGGSPTLRNMVDEIWNGGSILFVSAANDNSTAKTYPASYENAVAVGNSKNDDSRAPTSTYGDWVDIVAPGHNPTSTGYHHDEDYHEFWGSGTSYSAPITAAAAALLWSYDPSLTNVQVRELLETTGPLSSGFNVSPDVEIRRLDIAAALAAVNPLMITAPKRDRIVYSGLVELEPVVEGNPDRVDLYVDGAFVESLMAQPWMFQIDTTGTDSGLMTVKFVAVKGAQDKQSTTVVKIDNSPGRATFTENFEGATWNLFIGDLKSYSQGFLDEIKSISAGWTIDDVSGAGAGLWGVGDVNPHAGVTYTSFTGVGDAYGEFEIDALATTRVDLQGVTNPSLVFFQHYNIEQAGSPGDVARILVTADGGQTFTPAPLREGGPAEFSGYQADWQRIEVDLSAFTAEPIHIVFAFESDAAVSGEQAGQPAGWFIDDIVIANEYIDAIPIIDSVDVGPESVIGEQPDVAFLNIEVHGAQNVTEVRYILDCIPLGETGGDDLEIVVDAGAEFAGILELHQQPVVNQIAMLRVEYLDGTGVSGEDFEIPITLFNFLGDVNADGVVDTADSIAYNSVIGLTSEEPGYIAFFDSNLDGVITEADAAAVGYFWGPAGL